MVSDKTIHKAFRMYTNLQKTLRVFFHYLPKLYFGFIALKSYHLNKEYGSAFLSSF